MPTLSLTLPNNGDDAIVDPYNTALLAIQALLNGGLDADNLANEAVTLSKLATAVQQALTPAGAILAYGGATAPSGFLLCYGQAVSRSTYSVLFGIIGTSFGVGDGSTTFNLPDLRGRVPVGADDMGGTAANRFQRSTTISTTNANSSATVGSASGLSVGMYISSTNVPANTTITSINGTTITMSANATATASGTAARFSMVTNAQSIGSAGGSDVHLLITAQMPAHTHAVQSFPNGAGGGGQPLNSNNTGTSSNPATTSAGGDQNHPNVQPSQLVNYVIKT